MSTETHHDEHAMTIDSMTSNKLSFIHQQKLIPMHQQESGQSQTQTTSRVMTSAMESSSDASKVPSNYGVAEYWSARYDRNAAAFDWYVEYEQLEDILLSLPVRRDGRVLHIGVGTSRLPEQMSAKGFTAQTAIDIAANVIRHRQGDGANGGIVYEQADAAHTAFDDAHFDLIIDKGTIDAVVCADADCARRIIVECRRLLRVGGCFLLISHMTPQAVRAAGLWQSDGEWSVDARIVQCSTTARLINAIRGEMKRRSTKRIDGAVMAAAIARVRSEDDSGECLVDGARADTATSVCAFIATKVT